MRVVSTISESVDGACRRIATAVYNDDAIVVGHQFGGLSILGVGKIQPRTLVVSPCSEFT